MKKINNNSIILGLKILSVLAFGLIFLPFGSVYAYTAGYINPYTQPMAYNPYQPVLAYDNSQVNNPTPTISYINPSSANRYASAPTITITGSGFNQGSVARVNGYNRYTTYIDYSHLLIEINGSDMANANGFYITVWNGAPGGGTSNAAYFTLKSTSGNYSSSSSSGSTSGTSNSSSSATSNTSNSSANTTNTENASSLASNAIFGSTDGFYPSGIVQWVLLAIVILVIIILVRRIFGAKKNYDETPLKHA